MKSVLSVAVAASWHRQVRLVAEQHPSHRRRARQERSVIRHPPGAHEPGRAVCHVLNVTVIWLGVRPTAVICPLMKHNRGAWLCAHLLSDWQLLCAEPWRQRHVGVMRPRYQREIPDTRLRKVSEDEADAELNERGWAAAARKAVHISHLLEVVAARTVLVEASAL